MRDRRCKSIGCNPEKTKHGKPQSFRPVSKGVEYVRATVPTLQATKPPRKTGEKFSSLLRSPADLPSCPRTVESWCIKCQKQTETASGSSVFVDTEARWTIGKLRPLYVERTPRCLRCKRISGKTGRKFIPLDNRTLSVSPRELARFIDTYGAYDPLLQAYLWENYLPLARQAGSYAESDSDLVDDPSDDDDDSSVLLRGKFPESQDFLEAPPEPPKPPFDSMNSKSHHTVIGAEEKVITLPATEGTMSRKRPRPSSDMEHPRLVYKNDAETELREKTLKRSAKGLGDSEVWKRLILDQSAYDESMHQVEIWCQICKENTVIADKSPYNYGERYPIDKSPNWTKVGWQSILK